MKLRLFLRKYIVPFIPTARIKSTYRININIVLKKLFKTLKPGITLDVGSKLSPYKQYIPYTKYLRLDTDKTTNPDICCDLHDIRWESNYFDTIIATEVLEHLYDPQKAINEIYRIMKEDGTCILTTRFICVYHPDPKDYYRFSEDALSYLFRNFKEVHIYHHGNRLQVIWHMINTGKLGIILNIFNPLFARIHFKKTMYPSGFIVLAKK